jgi:signal transduction histidine kinase
MEKSRVQRKLIVNKRLQLTVLGYSLLLSIWVSISNIIFQLIFDGHMGALSNLSVYILIPAGLVVVITITVLCGFLLTNRIAGPLHKLRYHMEDVIEGKTTSEINFRKDDYFAEIIEPYNKILAELQKYRK